MPATIAATLRPHDHLHFTVPSQTLRGQSWTITVETDSTMVFVRCNCRAYRRLRRCWHAADTLRTLAADGDFRWHEGRAIGAWVDLGFEPDGAEPEWIGRLLASAASR